MNVEDLFSVGRLVQGGVPRDVAQLAVELSGDIAERAVDKSDTGADWDWGAEIAAAAPARAKFASLAKRIFGNRAEEIVDLGRRCVEAERAAA